MEPFTGAARRTQSPMRWRACASFKSPRPGTSPGTVPHLADPADAERFLGRSTNLDSAHSQIMARPVALIFSVPPIGAKLWPLV